MNRSDAKAFCRKYAKKHFYQPVVFEPGIIEIQGKWSQATQKTADLVLGDCSGKSVLDLGCLHGFFLHEAIKRGAIKAVGVDHDVVEISIAKEINGILDYPIDFVHARLEEYESEQFDIVLLMNVLHVLNEPQKNFRKILGWVKERLIVEHDVAHQVYFPVAPASTENSLRSAGHRKLSIFEIGSTNLDPNISLDNSTVSSSKNDI